MDKKQLQIGVILFDDAFSVLENEIAPYVQQGRNGKFIYCQAAEQIGSFMRLSFRPDQYKTSGDDLMHIFIPFHFVKFMASCEGEYNFGFIDSETNSCPQSR